MSRSKRKHDNRADGKNFQKGENVLDKSADMYSKIIHAGEQQD